MTVALLEHNGIAVEVPKQDCCGLPLQSNGLFNDARAYVHRLAERLAPFARAGVDIVGTSTSCTLMLKREALEILEHGDDQELRRVSERVYDICEYLVAMHGRGELETDFAPLPETVTYHAPCQQQGHGIGKPALELMALIPDLRSSRAPPLLRHRRHLRAQAREVRDRDGRRRGPVPPGRREPAPTSSSATPRRAAGRSSRRPACAPCTRSRCCTAPTGSLTWSTSSSSRTARGWPRASPSWRGRWAASDVAIEPAGGLDDGSIGTDAERVRAAIERVRSPTTACSC